MSDTPQGKKKRGGARPGAGRPRGALSTMPKGSGVTMLAIKAAHRRIGPGAERELLTCLEHIYQRVVDVLEGRVDPRIAGQVLRAAEMLADAIAGPIAQKVEHGGTVEITVLDPYAAPPKSTGEALLLEAVTKGPPPSDARSARPWPIPGPPAALPN